MQRINVHTSTDKRRRKGEKAEQDKSIHACENDKKQNADHPVLIKIETPFVTFAVP